MTILDVISAAPDNLAVVLVTVERGHVIASAFDRPDLWAQAMEWADANGGVKPFPGDNTE